MKKFYTSITVALTVIITALPHTISAQTAPSPAACGQDMKMQQLFAQHPGLQEESEANARKEQNEGAVRRADSRTVTPPTYIVPVVFHIVHNYGIENISDAQILDAVAILNQDFRKLNPDTAQIVAPFDTLAADAEIEFRLAQFDPNGNCTNGIDRIPSLETNVGDDGSKLNQWPRDKYLNIWVVNQMGNGVAGYAYFPASVNSPSTTPEDGVIIRHDYVGSIGTSNSTVARTLTHMVAHWLGLAHLGSGTICTDGDGIPDTPVTMGWHMCQLTNNDVCNPGTPENVENFLETSYCPRMFTRGQCDFMHNVLNSSVAQRDVIWSNSNLVATGVLNAAVTCAPHADFKVNRNMVCDGGNVTLTDVSWGNNATSWAWTVIGADTLTSLSQNPLIVLNTPGVYDVQLIATNTAGSDTIRKAAFLTVSSDTATFNALYSESFETPNAFYFGYIANDLYGNGNTFMQTNSVGHTGTSSVIRPFGNSVEGDVDELITPSYFLSYNTSIQISFVYAYCTADTTSWVNTETFSLLLSTTCGQTWTTRWSRTGRTVETAAPRVGSFVPSASDWDTVVVNVPGVFAGPNVRFKFEFTSPHDAVAGDLYIDDINITAMNVGIAEYTDSAMFNVYPNPGNGISTIAYSLPESSSVNIGLYDLSGRWIQTIYSGNEDQGEHTLLLNNSILQLPPGTYFIRMVTANQCSTRPYVITSAQ